MEALPKLPKCDFDESSISIQESEVSSKGQMLHPPFPSISRVFKKCPSLVYALLKLFNLCCHTSTVPHLCCHTATVPHLCCHTSTVPHLCCHTSTVPHLCCHTSTVPHLCCHTSTVPHLCCHTSTVPHLCCHTSTMPHLCCHTSTVPHAWKVAATKLILKARPRLTSHHLPTSGRQL